MRRTATSAVVVLTLGLPLLAGCAPDEPDEVSTAGLLTAEDLGSGDWAGPFAEAVDTGVDGRNLTCGMLNSATASSSGRPVTSEAEVFWADGQTLVSSNRWSFDGGAGVTEDWLDQAARAEQCVRDDFSYERVDDVVVVQERNEFAGTNWVINVGVTGTDDAVVAVEVSYPEGTTDAPDIRKLLLAAVEASATLPK